MTLTLALVEILLSPYPESQSTANILDSRSECLAPLALPTEKGVSTAAALDRGVSRDGHGFDLGESGAPRNPLSSNAEPRRRDTPALADSQIFDRHGDDRFADNILRALEGLPQHGDDEEERDAAEEGALIEASGYPDPAYERNGR